MSILIKDFNGTELIKFPENYLTVEKIVGSMNCTLLFCGILLESLVIASILRVRQKTVDTLFVLSLCCADMIFNFYIFSTLAILLNAGGWSIGVIG